jgi:hypothetical protein
MKHSLLTSKVRLRGNLNGSLFNFEGPGGTSNKGSIALLFGWRRVSKLLKYGGVAQLGEHLLCKQGVIGSNPFISTKGRTKADGRTFWQTWAHSSGG